MYQLLAPYLSGPSHFIGCDNNPDVWVEHAMRLRETPVDRRWRLLWGDAYSLASSLVNNPQKPEDVPQSFNFDTQNLAGSEVVRKNWVWIKEAVVGARKRHRVCKLVLNHVLDPIRANTPPSVLFSRHLTQILDFGSTWNLSRKALLPSEDKVTVLDDRDFHGEWFGNFEVYRSLDRTLRMITVRLTFFDGKVEVYSKRRTV
jgi:hypothetical protein